MQVLRPEKRENLGSSTMSKADAAYKASEMSVFLDLKEAAPLLRISRLLQRPLKQLKAQMKPYIPKLYVFGNLCPEGPRSRGGAPGGGVLVVLVVLRVYMGSLEV